MEGGVDGGKEIPNTSASTEISKRKLRPPASRKHAWVSA